MGRGAQVRCSGSRCCSGSCPRCWPRSSGCDAATCDSRLVALVLPPLPSRLLQGLLDVGVDGRSVVVGLERPLGEGSTLLDKALGLGQAPLDAGVVRATRLLVVRLV